MTDLVDSSLLIVNGRHEHKHKHNMTHDPSLMTAFRQLTRSSVSCRRSTNVLVLVLVLVLVHIHSHSHEIR